MAQSPDINFANLSYFKCFLSEWSLFVRYAAMHGNSENKNQTSHKVTVLSNQHIMDLINGSFGFFYREHIHAFMLVKQQNFKLRIVNETAFTTAKKNIPAPTPMPDRTIEVHHKIKHVGEKNFDTSASAAIESKLKQLNKHFKENLIAHKRFHKAAYNETIKILDQIDLPPNELEKKQLCADESLSQITKRFKELNLSKPNIAVKNQCFFTRSLELKLHLAVYSTLGRKQQPHTDKDILFHTKKLKDIIKKCRTFESRTNENQSKTLNAINQFFLNE